MRPGWRLRSSHCVELTSARWISLSTCETRAVSILLKPTTPYRFAPKSGMPTRETIPHSRKIQNLPALPLGNQRHTRMSATGEITSVEWNTDYVAAWPYSDIQRAARGVGHVFKDLTLYWSASSLVERTITRSTSFLT